MEIIQLTCAVGSLAVFCMVYTDFTSYISDELLVFFNVLRRFQHDSVSKIWLTFAIIQRCFTNILAITNFLYDFTIIHTRLKMLQLKCSSFHSNDNCTMLKQSYSVYRCEYSQIEIQSKTIQNLQLFICIFLDKWELNPQPNAVFGQVYIFSLFSLAVFGQVYIYIYICFVLLCFFLVYKCLLCQMTLFLFVQSFMFLWFMGFYSTESYGSTVALFSI